MLVIGIDEAGYGPTLGPLCTGCAVFRCADLEQEPPDFWELLEASISKSPVRKGRLAVDDSKKIYQGPQRQLQLARSVLGFLLCRQHDLPNKTSLDALLTAENLATLQNEPWYVEPSETENYPLHRSYCDESWHLTLRQTLNRAQVVVLHYQTIALPASKFNRMLERYHLKSNVSWQSIVVLLRQALTLALPGERIFIVIDRQGGRKFYFEPLTQLFPEVWPLVVAETEQCSRYRIVLAENVVDCRFQIGAETCHMPVALASMAAKAVREWTMERFNAYFQHLLPGLKPTAGYPQDARRFLAETAELRARMHMENIDLIRRK